MHITFLAIRRARPRIDPINQTPLGHNSGSCSVAPISGTPSRLFVLQYKNTGPRGFFHASRPSVRARRATLHEVSNGEAKYTLSSRTAVLIGSLLGRTRKLSTRRRPEKESIIALA